MTNEERNEVDREVLFWKKVMKSKRLSLPFSFQFCLEIPRNVCTVTFYGKIVQYHTIIISLQRLNRLREELNVINTVFGMPCIQVNKEWNIKWFSDNCILAFYRESERKIKSELVHR